jgi:hypothetical protein
MLSSLDVVTLVFVLLLGGGGLLLLLLQTPRGAGLARIVDRWLRSASSRGSLAWLDWKLIAVVAGAVYAAVIAFDVAYGLFACSGNGPSDIAALVASGRAAWVGGDPFTVTSCGSSIQVPYGVAAVVIDAIGSLGGVIGVAAIWGLVALALLPLTWKLAGPDRRFVTIFVATSVLYLPLVSAQIDGATNALVPVAVLLAILLARRNEPWAAGVGGFLATGRFPAIFPLLAATGKFRRPWLSAILVVAVFGAITALSFALWGNAFLAPVFTSQVSRRSFSLNLYGLLTQQNWLPAGDGVAVVQAVLTLAVVGAVWLKGRTVLGGAAIALTGVALLTQFLSFNILVGLLPVALLGVRPRWWLWAIGIVGTLNYDLAWPYWAKLQGIWWPYDLLGIVLTLLLLGLFVDLWRAELAVAPATGPTTS